MFDGRFARVVANWWDIIRRRKKLAWFTAGYAQVAVVFPFHGRRAALFRQGDPARRPDADRLGLRPGAGVAVVHRRQLHRDRRIPIGCRAAARVSRQGRGDRRRAAAGRSRSRSSAAATASRSPGSIFDLPGGDLLREDIALAARPGEPVLVTGPSGSGKSTLLRAIAGSVAVRPRQCPGRRRPRAVPAAAALSAARHAGRRDRLSGPRRRRATAASWRPRCARSGCPTSSISSTRRGTGRSACRAASSSASALPGCCLARPEIVFLDEATSALDEAAEAALYRLLREAEWRPTIVSVGHHGTLRRFHEAVVDLGRAPVSEVAGELMPRIPGSSKEGAMATTRCARRSAGQARNAARDAGSTPIRSVSRATDQAAELDARYARTGGRGRDRATWCGSPGGSARCATAACSSISTTPRARSRSSATRIISRPRRSGAAAPPRHRRSDRGRGQGPPHPARRADGQCDGADVCSPRRCARCRKNITASPISSCATASAIST